MTIQQQSQDSVRAHKALNIKSYLSQASPQRVVCALTVLIFALCLSFKIHFSSVGMWSSYTAPGADTPGLLYGSPKAIRSDEWLVGVPWLLSQARANPPWPTHNPSVGPASSALLVGLPARHWSEIFRPPHWGFYLFDFERAFSWLWMWRSVGVCAALMILFLELTGGLWLGAITGTVWIFFSGFVQWWLVSVAEFIAPWALACISLRYLFISHSVRGTCIAAGSLFISAVWFAFGLYPPFQVPLLYLGMALLPFLLRGSRAARGPTIWFRVSLFGAAVVLSLAAVVAFLMDNSATVAAMESTAYPGRRVSLGGGLSWWRFISGFFENNYTQDIFPQIAGNICEASSFIMPWPVSALLIPLFHNRAALLRFLPVLAYLILTTLWAVYGVPEAVAKATAWSLVPTTRALIGWGLGGAFLCVLTMSESYRLPALLRVLYVLLLAAGIVWSAVEFQQRVPIGSVGNGFYYSAALLVMAVAALVFRLTGVLALTFVGLCLIPHGSVNPVMRGLDVLKDIPVIKAVKRFDPHQESRWAVFGSITDAQLVKASGRAVVNGSQYAPDMEALRKLDPTGQSVDVYNRYAHVTFTLAPQGTLPSFRLQAADSWELRVDPCDERFLSYGVRYFVWMHYEAQRSFDCYERVFVGPNFAIYKSRVGDS